MPQTLRDVPREINAKLGNNFADRALFYAFKRGDYPIGEKQENFDRFFSGLLDRGIDVELDFPDKRRAIITEIKKSHGLPE